MQRRALDKHAEALAEFAEWEWQIGQVAEFVRTRGHCDLGVHPAADWLRRQRTLTILGALSPERQQRLAGLGFRLDQDDASWDATLERLRAWSARQKEGDKKQAPAPVGDPDEPALLAWLCDQQLLSAAGKLSDGQQRALAPFLFHLAPRKESEHQNAHFTRRWDRRFTEMTAFQKEHGHTRVPEAFSKQLHSWQHVQREFRRKGMLSAERVARLDAIGFEWERPGRDGRHMDDWRRERWDELFTRLAAFRERFGHCQVPIKWAEDPDLARWMADQRKLGKSGRMIPERKQRLDEIGFVWKASYTLKLPPFPSVRPPSVKYRQLWETRFAEITAFHKERGHTRVPKSFSKKLWHWQDVQRQFRRKGMLSAERIARLDSIGFEWERRGSGGRNREEYNAQRWEEFFDRLTAFKARFGHCQVPQGWSEDEQLASWVGGQRRNGSKKRLLPERRQRLDAIGFVWKPRVERAPAVPKPYAARTLMRLDLWDQRLAALTAYQQQHGHTRVPYCEDEALANWCGFQRERRRRGALPADRIAKLDAIGFEWERPTFGGLDGDTWRRQRWDYFFDRLTAYKARFGHCQVPEKWVEDEKLANWVASQRMSMRSGQMSAERKQRLDSLAFEWKPLTRPTRRGKRPRQQAPGPDPARPALPVVL